MAGLTIQHVVRNKKRFVKKLRILTRNNFWDVSRWLAGAYASLSDHLDQHKKPVLIRDHKMKWLDFGTTPDEGNLSPHPGFVWMKAGYSESIEWHKVRLTKQRNVDLRADGLWAMSLNSGWVPVKSRRLQDWQKLKKYVPNNKHGDFCPNGVPALPEKDNANDDSEMYVKCSVHICAPTLQLSCSKMRTPPPPNPYISEMAFSQGSKSIHTHTPHYGTKFWCVGRKIENTLKKCEFALRWQITDIPERYVNTCVYTRIHIHVYTSPFAPSSLAPLTRDLPLCTFLTHFACSRDMPMYTGKQRKQTVFFLEGALQPSSQILSLCVYNMPTVSIMSKPCLLVVHSV